MKIYLATKKNNLMMVSFNNDFNIKDYKPLFEVKKSNLYDIYEYQENNYVVSMVSGKNFAVVKKIEYKKLAESKDYESNIICPFCSFEDLDSWEFSSDSNTINCDRCYSEFEYQRNVTVEYSTTPIKASEIIKID